MFSSVGFAIYDQPAICRVRDKLMESAIMGRPVPRPIKTDYKRNIYAVVMEFEIQSVVVPFGLN